MKTQDRYVEVSFKLPGDDGAQFRAMVTVADSPSQAAEHARADTLRAHPGATEVQEFMQRALTPDRAKRVREQIARGTWEGWPLGSEA